MFSVYFPFIGDFLRFDAYYLLFSCELMVIFFNSNYCLLLIVRYLVYWF